MTIDSNSAQVNTVLRLHWNRSHQNRFSVSSGQGNKTPSTHVTSFSDITANDTKVTDLPYCTQTYNTICHKVFNAGLLKLWVATRKWVPEPQWWRHTKASQGKCPGRNRSALADALAVKSCNNTIIYKDSLTALADATKDLYQAFSFENTRRAKNGTCRTK